MDLKKYFDHVLDSYLLEENQKFSKDMPYYKTIVEYIPTTIKKILNDDKYIISGSCGKGSKSAAPFIAIMNKNVTNTSQKGIYVDIIFKSDMLGFYLALDQGFTELRDNYGVKQGLEIAEKVNTYFRNQIDISNGFEVGLVSENAKKHSREEEYGKTRIISKYYAKDHYTNEELINDIKLITKVYDGIVDKINGKPYADIITEIISYSSWESVYHEIALKLLEYKNNHKAMLDLMYEILIELGLFSDDDDKNCNLDNYNGVRCRYDDFDPFSFMNRFNLYKFENGINFIRLFQRKTGLTERVPDNFDGIPSVNPQNSCFTRFKYNGREKDINDYWNLFEVAIEYSQNQTEDLKSKFIKYYNLCINKSGCSYNITIGLFKLDPNFYINLDSTNRKYIKKEFNIEINQCPNGEEYLNIIQNIKNEIKNSKKYLSMKDFSKKAWLNKTDDFAVIGGDINMDKSSNEWIIPANSKLYNHYESFAKNGFIDWGQDVNYNVDDIVYIYSGLPESRIIARTIVEKVNMKENEIIDDSEFILGDFSKKSDKFVRLKLLEKIDDERLKRDKLIEHGLWGTVRGAAHIPVTLSKYIHSVIDGTEYNESEKLYSSNEIYYGGPGCGKSRFVKEKFCCGNNFIRTTFYPDYTNSDFIGQLIPKYNEEKEKLEYIPNPGPFTRALEMALRNANQNVYLVIEEINRGNAAAIFGDTFQLLDRINIDNENDNGQIGESEYEISNYIIEEYILKTLKKEIKGKVKIPANMSIIATMNTSDQNVYTLDSAFKRRWKMIHMTNQFDDQVDYDNLIGSKYVPMKNCNITWKEFVNRINKAIVSINTFGINSEDKQLGKYFVGTSELLDSKVEEFNNISDASKAFAEKVLMYIWEDIAKLEPSEWFNSDIKTLDDLLDEYEKYGVKVFSNSIQEKLNIEVQNDE